MCRIDRDPVLGDLRKQPVQKLYREQRVAPEAIAAQRETVSHDRDVDESRLPSGLDQRLLRKRAR